MKKIGLIAGPLFGVLVLLLSEIGSLSLEARFVAATAVWMAIWWATEAVHVSVTAFIPLVFYPFLGVSDIGATSQSYAHPIIYLFLGGFIMAIAVEKSGLHQRVALAIFGVVGVNARAIVGAFMVAAASISMWISNTSTTIMMLPIAMSVVYVIRQTMSSLAESQLKNFELAMYLGLAYGATVGGIATLVGTPPNAFMAGFMESNYQVEVDFARWMIIGVPLACLMLPIVWFMLVRFLFPIDFKASQQTQSHLAAQRKELGPISPAETRTAMVFLFVIATWILRRPLKEMGLEGVSDSGVAMLGALMLFLIPNGKEKKQALMEWSDAQKLPWGVLILFGGGLALASGMSSTGLTDWIGGHLAPLGKLHIGLLVLISCALVIFLTELTSNVATTATFLPIIAAIATQSGIEPLVLVVPVTLAASFAFMLPVATPPNAIVFSSGKVPIHEMMRAGLVLNLISIVVLTCAAVYFVPMVFA